MIALCLICAWGAVALAGTKTGMLLALMVALGPVAAYAALTAPIVFPFGLFLVLVPFDNLMKIESFGTLTKLLALMCAAAIFLRLILTRRYVVPDKAVLAWLPFLLLAIASLTWASDPQLGVQNVLSLLQLFALYALLAFMPIDRRTLGVIVLAVIAGGILAGAYGAYLFHSGQGVSSEGRLFINTGTQRIDPNHFAASLLVPLALSLTVFLRAKRVGTRILAILAVACIVLGIFISGSRGGLISSLVVVAYIFAFSTARQRFVLTGMTLAGLGVALAAFGNILSRFGEIAATGGAGRLGIWRVAAVAFAHRPIVGAGAGNFSLAYDDAFLSVPAWQHIKIVEATYWNIAPHNNLIWAGVELGIVGLAALLYAWWRQYRAVRIVEKTSEYYPLRIAIEAGIVAMFVAGLFLGTLTYKYLWLAFMLAVILRNAELDRGGLTRESVVSPVLQTPTGRR